ncbi:O-antigen translocase [Rosistilla oblonga]|uniref:O-antigen translocase n=1 Tax=Rosistilla oblonga TaxID=2527990 RepID=UPI003A979F87
MTINTVTKAEDNQKSDYATILKSSSIIGGSQVINMAIGLLRTKAVAVLIGPSGVGLVGTLQSVLTIASTVAGLGIQTSGVRDVAIHFGKDDLRQITRTVITLRRICWATGIFGFISLWLMAPWISQWTFQSQERVSTIRWLALTILLGNLAGGQAAIIQGTRRIGDLARISVIGGIASTAVSIGFYVWLGIDGIAPALLALSFVSLTASTYFSRKIQLAPAQITWLESFRQAIDLTGLGLTLVWSGLLVAIVSYLTRLMLIETLNLSSVGIYTAAFTLSGLLVNFVLRAMGADYYPRLTAASNDHNAVNRMVNQQTEIGLLLALPGLLATLTFAPLAIRLLYTAEFLPAAALLQWFALGCLGRVISWPMGFILLACSKSKTFAVTETATNMAHLAMIWLGLQTLQLIGVSIAYAASYLFHTILMLIATAFVTGFRWDRSNKLLVLASVGAAGTTLTLNQILPPPMGLLTGSIGSLVALYFCLNRLGSRLGSEHRLTKLICKFGST